MDYQEFRRMYEDQHPASVPQPEIYIAEYPTWVIPVVGAMFVTAAFFSGVHTVPIAYNAIDGKMVADWLRQFGAASTFVFIEAGVLLSAYLLVKKFNLAILGILLITIAVAMGANLYSVSKALNASNSDTFTLVITIFFGLVAPLMAALSGGIYVWLHQSDRVADAATKKRFKEAQIKWDKEIEREFKKFTKDSSRNFMNLETSREIHKPSVKSSEAPKPRVKLHEVAKQVYENGDKDLSVGEMMAKYNISQGSTSKVRELLTKNGFSKHE